MKNIECTFYRPNTIIIKELRNIVDKLEIDFHSICSGEVGKEDLRQYAETLVSSAKPLKKNPQMLFLGLDEPERMPSDARVDFFYKPTYLGTAIMINTVLQMPDFLEDNEKAVSGLLLACTGRGFKGHGFDDLKGMIETIRIFSEAGTADFIRKYPDLCPKFTQLFTESIKQLQEMIEKNSVCNEWGEDYREEAEQVFALLDSASSM